MKLILKMNFVIMLCLVLSCSGEFSTNPAQFTKLSKNEPTPEKTSTSCPNDQILSRDYSVAEKALRKAVLEKDNNTLRLGLKSPGGTIKQKTVEAISETNDKTFVPDLVVALTENQYEVCCGTESEVMQDKLNITLIDTLKKLTKIEIKVAAKPSSKDIENVIIMSREWLKKNPPKN